MATRSDDALTSASQAQGRRARLLLLACCSTHLITDGLLAAVYPLLPLMALDLQLGYAASGSIRTAMIASSSLFQLPVGILAAWIPETALLGAGMFWMSAGFTALALAGGFWVVMALSLVAGIGGSAQHPLATAIVSKEYESNGRGTAVSSLNFSGDLGKALFPTLAGLAAIAYGWRGAFLAMGILGIIASVAYVVVLRGLVGSTGVKESREASRGWGIKDPVGFSLLTAIGVIDNSTRVGVLTFLPFLMADKGLDSAQSSLLLTLIFACGAAGKLGCGLLSDRFGNVGVITITETVTAIATMAVVPVDPVLLIPVLVAFGFVLNGTSSALYTTVAEMVKVENRAKGYGLYYTVTLGSGIFAPLAYGLLADTLGISGSFVAIAIVTLSTVPMALLMRSKRSR